GLSRLEFAAAYQYQGLNVRLRLALLEPDGTYAAYSLPQGLGNYADVEVANPPPGTWTAVFFAVQNSNNACGNKTTASMCTVQWSANVFQYAPAGLISPPSLTLDPGETQPVQLTITSP